MIDTSDIRELTKEDFARGRKNPYAEKIRTQGYKIIIDVTPEDITAMSRQNVAKINNMESIDWLDLDAEEIEALKMYRQANG